MRPWSQSGTAAPRSSLPDEESQDESRSSSGGQLAQAAEPAPSAPHETASAFFQLSTSTVASDYSALEGLTCTAMLHSGDSFGEQILLGSKNRTATVVAREDCIVLSLHEKDFPRFSNIFGKGIGFFHPERLKRLLYKSGDMRTKDDLENLVGRCSFTL